jgi:N-acetyl sugar amidotransferase
MDKIKETLDRQLQNQQKEVKFCNNCVVSNQRPRIEFDEKGICSACKFAYEKQHLIDWKERAHQLEELCNLHRKDNGDYDVIVPCSGGKDSSMVAHRLKHDYGMHPLTVTWAPFMYTEIGWKNFQSFIQSGFTNIMGSPNGHLHRKLSRTAFEAVGDPWDPFAYGQMSFAFHMALQFNIKLIFFGENGEAEYGGSTKNNYKPFMPIEDWADLYFKGATIDDLVAYGLKNGLIAKDDFTKSDLRFYRPPPVEVLQDKGIQMHWFSFYHKWVPQENYYYAVEHTGFQANPDGRSEGTYSKYASLDDRMDGLHFYLAYIKFGIARTTSDAAHEVRDGHITREEAVALVHRYDGEFPKKYFHDCLDYMNISEEKFWEIVDSFRKRAPHLWEQVKGEWKLKHMVENI